jgi:hypothetical protein
VASAASELKLGFWVGLGITLALLAWSLGQMFLSGAVHGHG